MLTSAVVVLVSIDDVIDTCVAAAAAGCSCRDASDDADVTLTAVLLFVGGPGTVLEVFPGTLGFVSVLTAGV